MDPLWQVAANPDARYLDWAQTRRAVFATPDWAAVLAPIGATPLFAWNTRDGFGTLVACFRRGPLLAGVCGMPVAGPDWDRLDPAQALDDARRLGRAAKLDVLRLNRSLQEQPQAGATAIRPEAWIDDLAGWRTDAHKRRRKDLALARRAGPGNRVVAGFDPLAAHALYERTVGRHGGVVRYPPDYFRALAELATRQSSIRPFCVRDADAEMLGFAVLALDGDRANYLHGAASETGRRQGVSDLLLEALVDAARNAGATRLSLMASPWEQTGLAAFKAKWSDCRGFSVTHDLGIGFAGRAATLWLRRGSRREFALAAQALPAATP